MKLTKRISGLLCVFLLVISVSCSASPDETKLVEVLGNMSFPSKEKIIANKSEFLADLYSVLDQDKDFLLRAVRHN